MAAGVNYFRLLWNLYRQKRNAGMTKEQIGRLQKNKLEKLLLFAYDYSPYYRKAFEAKGITRENIMWSIPLAALEPPGILYMAMRHGIRCSLESYGALFGECLWGPS